MKFRTLLSRWLVAVIVLGTASNLTLGQSVSSPTPDAQNPAEYDAGPVLRVGLESAKFRWWAPANVNVRGVLVLIPGRGGDARGMSGDPQWQALATRIQFGIMGCLLKNKQDDPYTYQGDPDGVVSDLLNKSVNTLLVQNKQGVQNPPLAFWGHSAGGNVTQQYAYRHADRVVAAVLLRATAGPGAVAPGKEYVPIMIFVGKKDKPVWVAESLENYEKGRAVHATWTLALNPNEGHEEGKTKALAIAHIESAVALRLIPPTFSNEPAKLKRLGKESGWLGNTDTLEIAMAMQFQGKKKDATWLLDEATAKAWQAYMRGQ